ncbi:MAG TPA: YajG family lipoprotein, partial [Candidatus Sulfotelmatobacter sp.]|nr:YajG family lipoprotein [Candidatus Sulfotelmatobacter sp.]
AKVQVSVVDHRDGPKDKVSNKVNGYGMDTAPILANNDVDAALSQAIETELKARGFVLAAGQAQVGVDLNRFYSQFHNGFLSGSADADCLLHVTVKNTSGAVLFERGVLGKGKVENLQLASGDNAKIALDGALKDAVGQLMADQAFIAALLKANAATTSHVATPHAPTS